MSKIDIPDGVAVLDLSFPKLYFKWNDYDNCWDLRVIYTSEYFGGENMETVYSVTPPSSTTVLYRGKGKYREAPRVVEMYLHGEIHR